MLVVASSGSERNMWRDLEEVQALALGLLLVDVAKILFYKLFQYVSIFLSLQFVKDLLNDEETLLIFDHALHYIVSLQNLKESLDSFLEKGTG
jgi:hypothetical protein